MSRKTDTFSTKPSRNDRFAQMSRQEQVIEQKKREIQARLQQQQKEKSTPVSTTTTTKPTTSSADLKKPNKPLWKGNLGNKPNQSSNNKSNAQFNVFSNDGSFLDQFKQMNDTKKNFDQKITISSIKSDKVRDNQDRIFSDERNKPSRWSKSRSQSINSYTSDDSMGMKNKISRFSDPPPCDTQPPPPQQQIITSFAQAPAYSNSDMFTNNFTMQPPQTVQTQALQMQQPPPLTGVNQMPSFPVVTSVTAPMLVPPPLTIPGVPPPQIVQNHNVGALIAPPPPHASISNQSMVGGGISVPPPVLSVPVPPPNCSAPPPCGIELTSIPAPNPIPVHTIPQPEPINTLSIPPPAPLQLQNIPSPSPIRLNEIPNPKPIDLLNIPAPGEEPKLTKPMTDPDFIKNVPPPNKSVPPPALGTVTELPNVNIPPPNANPSIIPPPTSVPPPLHPPMQQLPLQHQISVANPPQLIGTLSSSTIPSLMAQPVLPPPGMARAGPPPPPTINVTQALVSIMPPVNVAALPGPPPVLNQPPPLAQTNQIPPMNFPPPLGPPPNVNVNVNVNVNAPPPGIDLNAGKYYLRIQDPPPLLNLGYYIDIN